MAGSRVDFKNPVIRWVDSRMPIFSLMQKEYGEFPAPKNFNYFWNFGALAMFMGLKLLHAAVLWLASALVGLIWIALAFCGAIRDYRGVTASFVGGLIVSVIGAIGASVAGFGATAMAAGFASGLILGLTFAIGSLGTSLSGWLADQTRLTRDEQRRARHILIQVAEDAGEDAVAAAREKAEDLAARLRAGEDFVALAKEFSDDPGSAAEGGDLGLFGKGMMVPEFEDAAFALAQDQISDPVRSPFGFHIIQVTEIQAAQAPAFEEVREQLRQDAVRHQAEQLFFERAETLATLSFEQPDTLSTAATQLDLEIKESGWLTGSGGEGIGNHPKIVEAAFADDVIRGGNNSPVVEIAPDHVVVLRMLEHKESTQLPLDAVRDAIQATLRNQALREAAQAHGQTLIERLQAGAPLDTLAKELRLEVTDAGFVQRTAADHDREIIAEAFRIPRAADGRIASGGRTLANGDFVLVQVDEVRDGDLSAAGEDARTAFRRNLDQLYGTLETTALLGQLKARAEIVQHPERLD